MELIRILEASRMEIVRLFPDANLDLMGRTFRRQMGVYENKREIARSDSANKKMWMA
jgi:hypothetical protein